MQLIEHERKKYYEFTDPKEFAWAVGMEVIFKWELQGNEDFGELIYADLEQMQDSENPNFIILVPQLTLKDLKVGDVVAEPRDSRGEPKRKLYSPYYIGTERKLEQIRYEGKQDLLCDLEVYRGGVWLSVTSGGDNGK